MARRKRSLLRLASQSLGDNRIDKTTRKVISTLAKRKGPLLRPSHALITEENNGKDRKVKSQHTQNLLHVLRLGPLLRVARIEQPASGREQSLLDALLNDTLPNSKSGNSVEGAGADGGSKYGCDNERQEGGKRGIHIGRRDLDAKLAKLVKPCRVDVSQILLSTTLISKLACGHLAVKRNMPRQKNGPSNEHVEKEKRAEKGRDQSESAKLGWGTHL